MAIKISKYFLILFPLVLITGPLASEIFMNFISIVFLYEFCRNRKLAIFLKNKLIFIILLFYIVCILSSITSEDTSYSLKTSIPYIRFLIFAVAVSWLIFIDKEILKKIFFVFLFAISILIFFAVIEQLTDYNIVYGERVRNDRLSSLFGDELILGSYLARFFPLFLGLGFAFKINYRYQIIFYILVIVTPVIIFLSGERTSFFFLLVGVLGCMILFNFNFKYKVCFTLIFIFSLGSLLIFNSEIRKKTLDRTLKQIKPKQNEIYFFSDEHEALAISAIKVFKDNFFLGSGPKTFRIKCQFKEYEVRNEKKIFGCYNHPHNTYLQILAETGILGFSIIFILFIFLLIKFLNILIFIYFKKDDKKDFISIGCCVCFFITLFPIVPGANFFNNYINMIYYYPLGIYLSMNLRNKIHG
jgi:O-antigen ligase